MFRLLKRFIESKLEAYSYSNKAEQNYTCLIFVTYLREIFAHHRSYLPSRFLSIISCACFQLITLSVCLQLALVSTKNYKVLFSQMFETLYCVAFSVEYVLLVISHREHMELMKSVNQVFIRNHKCFKKILNVEFIASAILTMILLITTTLWCLQSLHPRMAQEQLALTPRKYPSRRFKTDFFVPFDYSISPYYEVGWILVLYYGITLQSILFETVTTMPFITLHIKGQLDIIAYYLRSIGNNHFVYTDIQRGGKISLDMFPPGLSGVDRSRIGFDPIRRKSEHTKRLIVAIIKHHQNVNRIINSYEQRCQVVFGLRLLVTVVLMVTNLCQLKFTDDNRFYLCANIIIISQFNYFLCTGSELIDSGVANVHRSACNNLWYTCDSATWQLLRPLLLVTHRKRHFKFMQFYTIDYRSFVSSLRITYSLFVLLMKFS